MQEKHRGNVFCIGDVYCYAVTKGDGKSKPGVSWVMWEDWSSKGKGILATPLPWLKRCWLDKGVILNVSASTNWRKGVKVKGGRKESMAVKLFPVCCKERFESAIPVSKAIKEKMNHLIIDYIALWVFMISLTAKHQMKIFFFLSSNVHEMVYSLALVPSLMLLSLHTHYVLPKALPFPPLLPCKWVSNIFC